ncbi:MAG: glycosyltransferase family 2 protein [Candidatus Latescibacterota bacterium]|nr:MAG: glycosyltransferase family 2 protein [Candidatus Latescibacterota bacterium]
MNRSVFVVLPVYNEGRVVASAIAPLLDRGYTAVAVDDGSTDDTWPIIRSLPIHSLRHPVNLGQGAALQTGMTYALEHGAEYIVHFDADGQHRVEDVDVLLEPLRKKEADVVLGSRFLRDEDRRAVPPVRRMLLKGGVIFNGLLTRVWLTDAHNGFRAMTREAAATIGLRENRFAHASEILIQFRRNRLRVVERPTAIIYTDRSQAKGQSSLNAIKIVVDMILRRIFR